MKSCVLFVQCRNNKRKNNGIVLESKGQKLNLFSIKMIYTKLANSALIIKISVLHETNLVSFFKNIINTNMAKSA